MEIKAGTQNGTKYKLKGKGLKIPNSSRKGDMYVVIKVMIPNKITREQKKLLEALKETNLETNSEFKDFERHL